MTGVICMTADGTIHDSAGVPTLRSAANTASTRAI